MRLESNHACLIFTNEIWCHMRKILDKKGREIKEFAVIKVFHYTAALRREKVYMYKWVMIKDGELFGMHLTDSTGSGSPLWPLLDEETGRIDAEIVQQY